MSNKGAATLVLCGCVLTGFSLLSMASLSALRHDMAEQAQLLARQAVMLERQSLELTQLRDASILVQEALFQASKSLVAVQARLSKAQFEQALVLERLEVGDLGDTLDRDLSSSEEVDFIARNITWEIIRAGIWDGNAKKDIETELERRKTAIQHP